MECPHCHRQVSSHSKHCKQVGKEYLRLFSGKNAQGTAEGRFVGSRRITLVEVFDPNSAMFVAS